MHPSKNMRTSKKMTTLDPYLISPVRINIEVLGGIFKVYFLFSNPLVTEFLLTGELVTEASHLHTVEDHYQPGRSQYAVARPFSVLLFVLLVVKCSNLANLSQFSAICRISMFQKYLYKSSVNPKFCDFVRKLQLQDKYGLDQQDRLSKTW